MENLKLTEDEVTGEMTEINQQLWENIGGKLDFVLSGDYLSVQTSLEIGPRRGRSSADVSASNSLFRSVENKLASLCKHLRKHPTRLKENQTPKIIKLMADCMDFEEIIKLDEEDYQVNEKRIKSLKGVARKAQLDEGQVNNVVGQYDSKTW